MKTKVLVGEKPFIYSGEIIEETEEYLVILDEKTQTQIRVYKKNITGEWRDLK
jgi:RNase P/RNase MRP subunit p29